jgi:rhamnulose-1-phosphate aldolase/alcohol dehydrogenase
MAKNDPSTVIPNLWDDAQAASMGEAERLVYRSNLLGSDKRITNYGGGNTSSKILEKDPLTGQLVEVLWVKGSGGDNATIKLDGFATLYMEKLRALKGLYRGVAHEDEMVGYLPHCTFNLNPRAASIDTPLHAFVPRPFVDHMHPDAIIAIAASKNSRELTQKIFGADIGWLPWKRPGFELGLWLEKFCRENPAANGVILESHGLFTWGDTPKSCYDATLAVINKAVSWFAEHSLGKSMFGGAVTHSLSSEERRARAAQMMPKIRGLISTHHSMVGHFDDAAEILEFVNSKNLNALAALGTSCPDHFLRTKICPLVIEDERSLSDAIATFRENYAKYYDTCKHANSPAMRDANPVVFLVPQVGMITFAKDKTTARISAEFYVNAINVMRGASAVSTYVGLPQQDAFDIEYWVLEEAKLQRMPKPKSLAGRIALVTGGASGIGLAIAQKLASEGACVVLADINEDGLKDAAKSFAADTVHSVKMDVTQEDSVIAGFTETLLNFGGLDIVVNNAGIAIPAAAEETSLEVWNKQMAILGTGYFLVGREGFRILKSQGCAGSMIYIASKNGMVASPGTSAYGAMKAAEIHLARVLAAEGAAYGIRVNTVNPDAVLRGSKIMSEGFRKSRAETLGIKPEELDDHYRKRSLLQRSVYPEDIAEAVYWFASDVSNKSTGNILNVDAGHLASFTR